MGKKTFRILLLVVVVLSIGMVGCAKREVPGGAPEPASPATANPPAPEIDRTDWPVIVAFGDSLTFGQGVPFEESYPSQLQAELDRLGYRYRVVNAGISGDLSGGGLARIETVLKQNPAIVILELGANDGLQGRDPSEMEANLKAIIERLQGAGSSVVLAGMQTTPNLGPEYTADFAATFVKLADTYNLPLIPFFLEGVAANPDLNLPDQIHPTAEGYVYVVKNVLQTLQPLLQTP